MKRAAILAAVLTFAPVVLRAESVHSEKSFANGGRVQMYLSGGDYEVRAGASDKIVVTASADGEAKFRGDISANGNVATIRTDGPHSNFHVVIEVPPKTDLYIRLTAGDMRVKSITGNKDIESHAGDLDIDVIDPDSYGRVDASVGAGDLNASPFNVSKDGLFRSFHQQRKGQLTFHAHLGAGDLSLH
jgi:hypothetical protein